MNIPSLLNPSSPHSVEAGTIILSTDRALSQTSQTVPQTATRMAGPSKPVRKKRVSTTDNHAPKSVVDVFPPTQRKRKDVPELKRGPPVGLVNYRPHVEKDSSIVEKIQEFRLRPENGTIDQFVDKISYSSDKRRFHETGRTCLHGMIWSLILK
jgi:hypothetical protein